MFIYVLQHPEETGNPKGSAIIAELGLEQYQRWVGEDFKQHEGLNKLLNDKSGNLAVLYPAEGAVYLTEDWKKKQGQSVKALLVIDGTWRKAKKIWELNTQLHNLPLLCLQEGRKTRYRIRKAPQEGYLSTVECIVEGLRILENCHDGYQPLLDLFTEMIDFQIDKMGKQTYLKNYQKKK